MRNGEFGLRVRELGHRQLTDEENKDARRLIAMGHSALAVRLAFGTGYGQLKKRPEGRSRVRTS
jgi:hypothetical protein